MTLLQRVKNVMFVGATDRVDAHQMSDYAMRQTLVTPVDAAAIVRLLTWQLCYRCARPDCASKSPPLTAPAST